MPQSEEVDQKIVIPPLIGAGGGKGGGRPSVSDVSGTSTDYATVLMGLGEGQIEGIINGDRGIFLDDTPLKNSDNSQNFQDINYVFSPGTLNQSSLPVASGEVSSETSVDVAVTSATPVNRTIINADLNGIRVRFGVQLQKQEGDGDIKQEELTVKVFIQEDAGAFVERLSQRLRGRFPQPTVFQYYFPVSPTASQYTVRVQKIGADSTDTVLRNLQWMSYSEVISAQLEYPNTAVLWMQIPSKQFKSVPRITIDVGGMLFQIPSNATVTADRGLNFSGGWNGSFYVPTQAIADPAWILYGLMTNKRFGLGINPNEIDKFSLYSASQYNNALVPNGFGGTERRFLFNGILQGGQEAYEVIRAVCAGMAAKPFWDGNKISFWQDRPAIAINKQFTNADVEEGRFVYTSQEYKAVSTVAKVTWNDPSDKYNQQVELVEDVAGINKFGVQTEEFTAFGETRRGGATRAGRRVLLSSRLDNEQIAFKARAFAIFCQPGDVIQVADNRRSRVRKAGLVNSATTTTITLDSPVDLVGSSFQIWLTMPDLTVQQRAIANNAGTHSVITLSSALPAAPLTHSNWVIQDSAALIRKYRVISVSPDRGNPSLYEIVGKLYVEGKYAEIENGWALTNFEPTIRPPVVVPAPRNVGAIARLITVNGVISYTLDVVWEPPLRSPGVVESFVSSYFVEFKRGENGIWGDRRQVEGLNARYENIGSGTFYARVAAIVDSVGRVSAWTESNPATISAVQYFANFTSADTSIFATEF